MPLSFAHRDPVQAAAPVRSGMTDFADFIKMLTGVGKARQEQMIQEHVQAQQQKVTATEVAVQTQQQAQVQNGLHVAAAEERMKRMQELIMQMEWNSKTKAAVEGKPVVDAQEVLDAYDEGGAS